LELEIFDPVQEKWSTQQAGELADPLRLLRRFRPEPVIDVPDGASDTHPDGGRGQGDRIGAARARHQHRNVMRQAGVNGGFDAVRQISHSPSVAPRDTEFRYALARRVLRTQFSCGKGGHRLSSGNIQRGRRVLDDDAV
jgi:hypothetical protein